MKPSKGPIVTTDPPRNIVQTNQQSIVILHIRHADTLKYTYDNWSVMDSEGNLVSEDNLEQLLDSASLDIQGLSFGVYTVSVTAQDKATGTILKGGGTFTIELDFEAVASDTEGNEIAVVTEGDIVLLTVEPASLDQEGMRKSKEARRKAAFKASKDYLKGSPAPDQFFWETANDNVTYSGSGYVWEWDTTGLPPGAYDATATFTYLDGKGNEQEAGVRVTNSVKVMQRIVKKGDILPVTLRRTAAMSTHDEALWVAIRNRCEAISFTRFNEFIQKVFCEQSDIIQGVMKSVGASKFNLSNPQKLDARLSINAVDSYNVLRLATEIFLLVESGIIKKQDGKTVTLTPDTFDQFLETLAGIDENEESRRFNDNVTVPILESRLKQYFGSSDKLPYLSRILDALLGPDPVFRAEKLPYCDYILQYRYSCPSLLELIWSYWHEEGMLVQTMNVIAMRFQNRRGPADRDPLSELTIDPLRPLNNLLWGYIQNEHNRLTIPRRAYEYDSQYGLTLYGKAVPMLRSADSRSKFLEAFHNLLYRASIFYREDADTTVIADAYPLLKAIREVHLVLAEGAHNQFGDLPWTARVEMLIEQWLLARPEMQMFIHGRPMVPYREEWMGRVDAMKKLQGWNDTTITHFQELGMFGEQIILSIRYGDWIVVNNEDQAKNWARYWKPEIQGYIHAYRASTGVDLNNEQVDTKPPWVHLKRQEERRLANAR